MARFDIGDAFTGAFRLTFRNFGVLLRTQGLIIIIMGLMGIAFQVFVAGANDSLMDAFTQNEDPATVVAEGLQVVGVSLAWSIVSMIASVLAFGIGLVAIDAAARGEAPTLGQAWALLQSRAGNLIGTMVLVGLAIFGIAIAGTIGIILILPFIAAMVFAVIVMCMWAVAGPVSVFERRGATGNLKRSRELTAGSKGAVFVVYLLLFLVVGLASSLASVPSLIISGPSMFSGTAPATLSPAAIIIAGLLGIAANVVTQPLIMCATYIIYRSLEVVPEPAAPATNTGFAGSPAYTPLESARGPIEAPARNPEESPTAYRDDYGTQR